MPDSCSTTPPYALLRSSRILLVDDHPLFRSGLRNLLETEIGCQIVGEAENAQRTLEILREIPVDAAIVDLSLPGTDGLELIKTIKAAHPQLRLLVLSMHDERTYATRALRAGASGYLMKVDPAEAVVEGVRSILSGGLALSERYKSDLLYRSICASKSGSKSPVDGLSDRELEVLNLIGSGLSTREIAARIFPAY